MKTVFIPKTGSLYKELNLSLYNFSILLSLPETSACRNSLQTPVPICTSELVSAAYLNKCCINCSSYIAKGKLRKEASWNSWRDDKIPNDEFDNVPTEGFVLNKKAGDYSTGWDHRHAYCRVYDPRGFEFEITIENLLYILENANCIKGKGLEGEFIYGWDGKDLVLMPVESPDYKQIAAYNKIVHNNESIKTRDLILGATYLTKENIEWIYMGRFETYGYGYEFIQDGKTVKTKSYEDIPNEPTRFGYTKISYKGINNLPYELASKGGLTK